MAWKILKQFIPVDFTEGDPEWAHRDTWLAILPDGGDVSNDKEDIYDTKAKAESDKVKKEDDDKVKKPGGNDKVDKFGKKLKNRKYKILDMVTGTYS